MPNNAITLSVMFQPQMYTLPLVESLDTNDRNSTFYAQEQLFLSVRMMLFGTSPKPIQWSAQAKLLPGTLLPLIFNAWISLIRVLRLQVKLPKPWGVGMNTVKTGIQRIHGC